MTKGDGNGALKLHNIPTLGQVKRNLDAAKDRCEKGQRPYPPLLIDLDYVIRILEAQFAENASLRFALWQAIDHFSDLVGEPEYGEVAKNAGKKWLLEAQTLLKAIDANGQEEGS